GGELLLGHGDMMFLHPGTSKVTRAQGTLVEDSEIRRTVKFLKKVAEPSFEPQLVQIRSGEVTAGDEERDELFEDAVRIVLESQRGSVSLLQRRLSVGYSRASRLIEQIADAGIIGPFKGSQAREVHMTLEEYEQLVEKAHAQAESDGEPVPDEMDDEYQQ
ncbi:MAG: DNA translocase FtsK, partial [Phycisphaeraceae bacterium]|nr:DNA translocase FtsK [Phycisphaeraceae bacterium]